MYEQAYHGTCPADDSDSFGISVKLSHPHDVEYPDTITIGCPIETLGENCPDGGTHTLSAITLQEYAALGGDDDE